MEPTTSKTDTDEVTYNCSVCGSSASYHFYGAIACDSCRLVFFLTIPCYFGILILNSVTEHFSVDMLTNKTFLPAFTDLRNAL